MVVFNIMATLDDTRMKQWELIVLLEGMDVPKARMVMTDANLRWLNRNLFIRNSEHPSFSAAVKLIADLSKRELLKCQHQ